MEPVSNQDGVVNMTRAKEALSPWLNHPRRTVIFKVEGLVLGAAVLLLLQHFLGSYRRRRHNSFVNTVLRAFSKLMKSLIIYTFSTLQSSPIKNSSYPVWAGFLIMASAGPSSFRQYDFYDSFYTKYFQVVAVCTQDLFYFFMVSLLLDPNTYTFKTFWDQKRLKKARASSTCVIALIGVVLVANLYESLFLVLLGYKKKKKSLFIGKKTYRTQVAERTQESDDRACDSDPRSMKGYNYAVYSLFLRRLITIDQAWDHYGNSADGKALKDLCLSCALFQRLILYYFGKVYTQTRLLKDHDFFFKKLLPSEGDFKRTFRIIEVELGFCYDFFFTKYHSTFEWMNLPVPFIEYLIFLKVVVILIVAVLAMRKSLVLETPNPIIEVKISETDYIITLLVLCIALILELVQIAVYLASNWAQVSLACMHVKKHGRKPSAYIFGEVISLFRRSVIFTAWSSTWRNKIDQHSVIFRRKQPDTVEVSDAVKRAIAGSLISKYGKNLNTNEETSLWQNQMFHDYSWALNKDISQLKVMLIWHIATEYCELADPSSSNQTSRSRCNKHRGFAEPLFGYVLQLLPNHRRNRITHHDIHRGIAVHLSRYCAYLIGSVPELLPYHEADIAELAEKVMEERTELFGFSYRPSKIYSNMKNLQGTEEEDHPRKIFQKGVKLGKQLKRLPNGDHWAVLQDFWAETIIHAAASRTTTKQHMQHLENGGEFLTHVWALLFHAGILNLKRNKDQEDSVPRAVV